MFHCCNWWEKIIGIHSDIKVVDTWELKCFGEAWDDWITSGHDCSTGDKKYYDTIIKKYTNIVGIAVKKR